MTDTIQVTLNTRKDKYGNLTLIEPTVRKRANGSIIWKIKCDCGNIIYRDLYRLKNKSAWRCSRACSLTSKMANSTLRDQYRLKFGGDNGNIAYERRLELSLFYLKSNLYASDNWWLLNFSIKYPYSINNLRKKLSYFRKYKPLALKNKYAYWFYMQKPSRLNIVFIGDMDSNFRITKKETNNRLKFLLRTPIRIERSVFDTEIGKYIDDTYNCPIPMGRYVISKSRNWYNLV